MITLECWAGSLVELRVRGTPEMANEEFDARFDRLVAKLRGPAVVCADLRESRVLSPNEARGTAVRMRAPRLVQREALLVPDTNAVVRMQAARLTATARGENICGVFTDPREVYAWLDPDLTMDARARLRRFLESPPVDRRDPS